MDIKHIADILEQDWVSFECSKLSNAKVVWAAHDDESVSAIGSNSRHHEELLKQYAYVNKNTACFARNKFDLEDNKHLIAERYGGEGIGLNGGGGRCGNTGECQLKGVGANAMVGDHNDKVHAYGGLDAVNAIVEVIYTNLLNTVLPLGAIPINALILTGRATATFEGKKCWGVIMVRERCVRPGHFMRAPSFKMRAENSPILVEDVARVRRLNKKLLAQYSDPNEFILYLGTFLQACANQFAFARAARLMHGTLTPSNISMDGRWLDLPLTTFVQGGTNQSLSSSFFSESQSPATFAIELLHGFSKYNQLNLNHEPLVNYYAEQFDAYFRLYLGFTLGINLESVNQISNEAWQDLTSILARVIHSDQSFSDADINPSEDDPVNAFITALFLSLSSPEHAKPFYEMSRLPPDTSHAAMRSFAIVMQELWQCSDDLAAPPQNQLAFNIGTALIAHKRAYLAQPYYLSTVLENVIVFCREKTPNHIASFIDGYYKLTRWIFKDLDSIVVLFQSTQMEITYSFKNNQYEFRDGKKMNIYNQYQDLFESLQSTKREKFSLNNYCFFGFFETLFSVIPHLETACSGSSLEK